MASRMGKTTIRTISKVVLTFTVVYAQTSCPPNFSLKQGTADLGGIIDTLVDVENVDECVKECVGSCRSFMYSAKEGICELYMQPNPIAGSLSYGDYVFCSRPSSATSTTETTSVITTTIAAAAATSTTETTSVITSKTTAADCPQGYTCTEMKGTVDRGGYCPSSNSDWCAPGLRCTADESIGFSCYGDSEDQSKDESFYCIISKIQGQSGDTCVTIVIVQTVLWVLMCALCIYLHTRTKAPYCGGRTKICVILCSVPACFCMIDDDATGELAKGSTPRVGNPVHVAAIGRRV